MNNIGFLVAGFKGANFVEKICALCNVAFISTYKVKGTYDDSYDRIKKFCKENNFTFTERSDINNELRKADLIFIVGWQYIIEPVDERFVVFHDSLLPKYRGFAPTVTALIQGEEKIGVTALRPSELADYGPVYSQKSVEITYPIKIKDALLLLNDCYVEIGIELLDRIVKGSLTCNQQNESESSHSIWRDEKDYFIDWQWPSDRIARFVDAVGWPFAGARTLFRGMEIIIDDAEVANELIFAERHPGKIWSLDKGLPVIVCGKGMLRILSARDADGNKILFNKLRERLGQ